MSSIGAIGSGSSYADYGKIASGKKIQSAADGAAELSIVEKEDAQVRGLNAGAKNIGPPNSESTSFFSDERTRITPDSTFQRFRSESG